MRLAIAKAGEGIAAGQSPFGAVIVRGGAVVASAHNTVWRDNDPTAHAEVNAIRHAGSALQTINLGGCAMYTTCEPCRMCLAASHWSKIDVVYFGAVIAGAESAEFTELTIPAVEMVRLGGSRLRVVPGLLARECAELFAKWKAAGLGKPY